MQTNEIVIDVNEADYQIEALEERLEMVAMQSGDFTMKGSFEITCCQ